MSTDIGSVDRHSGGVKVADGNGCDPGAGRPDPGRPKRPPHGPLG